MNEGKYVFSQIMELVSYKKFQTVVNRDSGEYKVKDFNCWKQFLCMAFGQLTHRESLSDTIMCLSLKMQRQVRFLYSLPIISILLQMKLHNCININGK